MQEFNMSNDMVRNEQELNVDNVWTSCTVYKQGAEWVIDVQYDQSAEYFYSDDLQGVVSIINQEL